MMSAELLRLLERVRESSEKSRRLGDEHHIAMLFAAEDALQFLGDEIDTASQDRATQGSKSDE